MAALVRSVGPEDVRIPHMTWTVSQCAAHLVMSNHMYRHQVIGPGALMALEQTSEINDWSVEPFARLELEPLAADIESSTARFIAAVRELDEDATFTWWSGARASVDTAVALLIAERLVHGWDIARAVGGRWAIPADQAAIAMAGTVDVMPLLVDPDEATGFTATYELRLRGGPAFDLTFVDGALTTSPLVARNRNADCRISAAPDAMLLVGYGRVSQWRAALTGKVVASGRKPWLGLRLNRVLRNP